MSAVDSSDRASRARATAPRTPGTHLKSTHLVELRWYIPWTSDPAGGPSAQPFSCPTANRPPVRLAKEPHGNGICTPRAHPSLLCSQQRCEHVHKLYTHARTCATT